ERGGPPHGQHAVTLGTRAAELGVPRELTVAERQLAPQPQRAAVELEGRSLDPLLAVDGELAELRRLRQPGLTGGAEAVGGRVALPRDRHPAAVAADDLAVVAEERRVLAHVVG